MSTKPQTGIIIRTRNEARWIGTTLQKLTEQTNQNFEIIIVDSESTDDTLAIAAQFPVTIVQIKATDFTYPFAINHGISHSAATDYFLILSAHSIPIDSDWLQAGIDGFRTHEQVMGVYGPLLSLPKATLSDKVFHYTSYFINYVKTLPKRERVITSGGGGVLGFTNALIRKDLWEQYPINEAFAGGGEDGDWANHWFSKGYVAVKNIDFAVRHSHNLGPIGWYRQLQHWRENAKPQTFTHLDYRRDAAHQPPEPD